MRKRLLMATVLFLSAGTLAMGAATGKIAGRIVDGATGAPLIGANVMVEGTELGAAADDNGEYFILNVPPGTYNIRTQMIGYSTVITPGVRVQIDLTTTVDFEPGVETIAGEEVVVTAVRLIVQPDVSGSELNITADEIISGKFHRIKDLVTAQVGVHSVSPYEDRPGIRGSSIEESIFIVDGVAQVDPLTNRPAYQVNLDAVQEVKMQTGGFLARYGNLRSGVINVVTKEGGEGFHGSANVQYSAPGLKHFGPMLYGHDSPVGKPFVDPAAGAFTGLDSEGKENKFFEGWNDVANERLEAGDPHYGEPMEMYARWLWRHRSQDSIDELKRLKEEGLVDIEWGEGVDPDKKVWHQYGVLPDIRGSFTLGGPIPLLPRTTFFVSYDQNQMEYSHRPPRPTYNDQMVRGKVTTWIGPAIKLNLHGSRSKQIGGGGDDDQGAGIDGRIDFNPLSSLGSENKLWYPHCAVTSQQTRQTYGVDLIHTLSPRTYYEVRFSTQNVDYEMQRDLRNTAPQPGTIGTKPGWYGEDYENGLPTSATTSGVVDGRIGTEAEADAMAARADPQGWGSWRDWAEIKIGDYWYDESPKGYGPVNWRDITGEYRMESCNLRHNVTYSKSYDLAASIVSQVNLHNQVEAGVEFRTNEFELIYERIDPSVGSGHIDLSKVGSGDMRAAVYAMDKLEYKGFIANLGLRADMLVTADFPVLEGEGTEDNGPYSQYLLAGKTGPDPEEGNYNTFDEIPLKSLTHTKLSPRLGISHPISDVAKIFFNYGHMYQWPSAYRLYRIQYDTKKGNRVEDYGNPAAEPPRTIAYEIGYEHNLFNMMSLRVTGYYKDVNNVMDDIKYYPIGHGGSDYETRDNMEFRDVRGLEAFLELRRGVIPFVSGWASYNYLVESSGEFGFDKYYEDPIKQPHKVSTEVSNPDVRPIIKLNVDLHTPADFGPGMAGFSLLGGADMNLTYYWHRGEHFTWNPAEIPLVEDNLRWKAYQRFDLRLQKDLFKAGSFRSVFYVDVTNLFNNLNLTHPQDILDEDEGRDSRGNTDIRTDDDWAWNGHKWWKDQVEAYLYSMNYTGANQNDDGTFNNTTGVPGDGRLGDKDIDMPGFSPWTFLGKRDVYFGIRVYF